MMPRKRIYLVAVGLFAALILLVIVGLVYRYHSSRREIVNIPGTAPATMRIYCNPLLINNDVPALSHAFDAAAPGTSLKVVLYGPFPKAGEHGGLSLGIRLRIERGSVTVVCPDGEVTYYPDGKMLLDWKTKQLEVQEMNARETPKRGLALLSFGLLKETAGVDFPSIRLPDGGDLPSDDRDRVDREFHFAPAPGSKPGEFILELRKSADFRAEPSSSNVSRGV